MLDRLVRATMSAHRGDRYELTLKLFELAHMAPPVARLVGRRRPCSAPFARDAQQAVHPRHLRSQRAGRRRSGRQSRYWNVSIRVGSRIGMINTGSGHVFLAFASEAERR